MPMFRFIVLGLVCALVASCDEGADRSAAPAKLVRVIRASPVQYQPSTNITGEVKARIQTDLSFRVGGKVVERLADVGSRVRAGDILARIDDSEQRADVKIAEAGLQSARATVRQKSLAFERYESLLRTHTIAQATYDQSQEDLLTAQGSLQVAKAALDTARDVLSHTELKADADGIITARDIEVGQVVSAAQVAFTLAHDGPRDTVFNVFEAFFLRGQPQESVEVSAIDDRSGVVEAKIREVSPTIDTRTGTVRVKVELPDAAQWPLGTPAVGTFRSPSRNGIVLPSGAMASDAGMAAAWVVDTASHTVFLRRVSVSRYRTNDFIVTDGISPGELVVTEGGKLLRDSQPVTWEIN